MTAEEMTPLSALLWDLRAQVEGQLRCLTKIHRMHDRKTQPGDKHAIVTELQDVLTKNADVVRSCEIAIEEAEALPE
jgi:hypothetical protein